MPETKKKRGPGRPPGSRNRNSKGGRPSERSAKRKSSSAAKASARRKAAGAAEMRTEARANKRLADEIWGVVIIAVGFFLILCTQLKTMGVFGDAVHDLLRGLFGGMAYLLPYYFIVIAVCIFFHKVQHINGRTVFFSSLMFVNICMLNAARFIDSGNPMYAFDDLLNYYIKGVEGEMAGAVGMWFASITTKLIGKPGLIILSLAAIFVSALLVANTPLSAGVEKARQKREARLSAKEEAVDSADSTAGLQTEEDDKRGILGILGSRKADGASQEKGRAAKTRRVSADDERRRRELVDLMDGEPLGAEGRGGLHSGYGLEGYDLSDDEREGAIKKSRDKDEYIKQRVTRRTKTSAVPAKKDDEEIKTAAEAAQKKVSGDYAMPPADLLRKPRSAKNIMSENQLNQLASLLETTLREFNVDARVIRVTQGSSVTRFEIQPARGIKVSRITSLADDIALNLRAKSIRIEAPIPGKAAVGIEIENEHSNTVLVRELIDSPEFRNAASKISFAVGKDISGKNIVADLKTMPHLLIAGATGSGKSVCINTIITSMLYKASPDEVKFVMIDPKVVELVAYNDIPHLLIPVVTDPKKAASALNWAVNEMNRRYDEFAARGVKDLESYNEFMVANQEEELLPEIVIIIDELADLMLAAKAQVEDAISRLAAKARAAGMHLIVATQRPSVNVVTGVIKANIPSRIAFSVSSQVDSRTILDMQGAEKLLGKGDMLFSPVGNSKPIRVQGPFISESETKSVISHVKKQAVRDYNQDVLKTIESPVDSAVPNEMSDELTEDAIAFILKQKTASVSMLQRRFRIGYNRAARIIDEVEERGIIGPSDGSKPRQVLFTEDEYYNAVTDASDAEAQLIEYAEDDIDGGAADEYDAAVDSHFKSDVEEDCN